MKRQKTDSKKQDHWCIFSYIWGWIDSLQFKRPKQFFCKSHPIEGFRIGFKEKDDVETLDSAMGNPFP